MTKTKEILTISILGIFLFSPLVVSAQDDRVEFKKTLYRGMRNKDVKILQEFLKQSPEVYPQGLVTGYFGPLTEMAVKRLQKMHDIEQVGIVGPKTKARLNELIIETGFSVGKGGQQTTLATPTTPSTPGGNGNSATPATSAILTTPVPQSDQQTSTPKGNGPPTLTPSGTMPAIPAVPSSAGSGSAAPAVPATPAIPNQPAQDITPPTISNIQATNITETSATITWTTDEPASSEVYASISPIFSTATTTLKSTIAENVTSHSINLLNLTASTIYYYVVVSKDAAGNIATSTEKSFTTFPPPPTSYEDNIIRITSQPFIQERPAISGNKIVWQDNRNGNYDIYMYNLNTNIETRISDGSGDEIKPHISGNNVVYQGAGGTYWFDITSSVTTFIGNGTQPRIDGNNIVYQKYPSPRDIRLYDISTGQTSVISTNGESWPYISGNDIVYQGGSTLFHYNLNSGTETALVSTTIPFRGSVSNGRVAYDERREGLGGQNHDAYVYTLNTGIEKKLTSQSGGELGNISISGNRVVWTDTDDYNLYLYDLTTNQLVQLTAHPSQQYHSYIDGNRVVWADARNNESGSTNHDIYMLEL